MSMTNQDAAKDLFEEALAWPVAGPGQSMWHEWVLRAREAATANGEGDHDDLLSRLVKAEREDGLSSAQWESFLSEASQLQRTGSSDRQLDLVRSLAP